jgi:DNA-binding response OmpR family regulator
MSNLALRDPSHLPAALAPERALAELQVVRRRLERVALELRIFTERARARTGWEAAAEAAQTALRSVQAAIAAAPERPFEEVSWGVDDFAVDDLTISFAERRAWWASRELGLTMMELKLLVGLAREPTRVFTKAELLRDVWGFRSPGQSRTVDGTASRLRRKLVAAGAPADRYVVCIWGVGYALMRP